MALIWDSKDPDEVLDYDVVWTLRLAGDTIDSSTWVVPAGVTYSNPTFTANTTKVWLAGGTIGSTYQILNRITTAGGRTMDQMVEISIKVR